MELAVMRFRQSEGIEAAPLQDEMILFHAPSNRFCVLNRTSSFIWTRLKEPASNKEIASSLESGFSDALPAEVASDLDSAIEEMLQLGLIVPVEDAVADVTEVTS